MEPLQRPMPMEVVELKFEFIMAQEVYSRHLSFKRIKILRSVYLYKARVG